MYYPLQKTFLFILLTFISFQNKSLLPVCRNIPYHSKLFECEFVLAVLKNNIKLRIYFCSPILKNHMENVNENKLQVKRKPAFSTVQPVEFLGSIVQFTDILGN